MNRSSVGTLAFGIILTAVSLVACMEEPIQPRTASATSDVAIPAQATVRPVSHSVTGNGRFVGEGVDRTAAFNIREYADGTVDGWYRALGGGPDGADVRVRIVSLHVAGNQAWASGTVVAAADPANVGRPYTVRFVDDGDGPGAAPDQIGVGGFVGYDCMTEPDLPLRELTVGNLQIRN